MLAIRSARLVPSTLRLVLEGDRALPALKHASIRRPLAPIAWLAALAFLLLSTLLAPATLAAEADLRPSAVLAQALDAAPAALPAELKVESKVESKVEAKVESRAATVSNGIAQVTGLAISPLLVLVAIGLTDFFRLGGFHAEPGSLPLHANPWLLGPCAAILLVLGIKKFLSPAVPMPIRKIFDAAEYFEAKLSALVAAGVLLPSIISTVAAISSSSDGHAAVAGPGGWLMDAGGYLIAIPAVLTVFGCVWITFHVIDALIVLSPFAIVDAILVAARTSILALLGIALLISPYLALIVCLPIIVISLLVAGWCVRLDLFALSIASDLLLLRKADEAACRGPVRCFLAARGHGAPIRTMGHAEPRPDGGVRFTYRPLFILPKRTLEIPVGRATIVRGFLWATMRDDARNRGVVALPPRYRAHAATVAAHLRAELRDGLLVRGWKGLVAALRSIVSPDAGEPAPPAAESAARA